MPAANGPRWKNSQGSFERFGQHFDTAAGRIAGLWQDLTGGMALGQLWEDFKADAQAGYKFYSRDIDWKAFERQRKWKRRLYIGRALSWAMLRKLSPARRVFLLLIIAYIVVTLVERQAGAAIVIASIGLLFLLSLELADRVTMKRDLEIARDIQKRLVPDAPPNDAGMEIAFATRPANTVSGDYYDAFTREKTDGKSNLLLIVADVAGKGIPAALLMATIQASLRSLAAFRVSLPELVAGLNRYACTNSLAGSRFTTAFIAEWDPASRTLAYVNAGHNAPILKRSCGTMQRLEACGLPLGIMDGRCYTASETVFEPGDLLVVFTDGVVEAENESDAEFGEARLLNCVSMMRPASAGQALAAILTAVDAFVGRTRQHDDITALVALGR